MNEEERRARLIERLKVIFNDVQRLLLDDHIFWELQKLVEANPQFKKATGLFTQWMASSFVQAAAVGVRRQAKGGDDSISMRRFLAEVERWPSLISRAHYMSLFADSEDWLRARGKLDFDKLAGADGDAIPVAVVQQQVADLAAAVAGIEHYVDRRVAHYDPRALAKPTPTFADLSQALAALEKLVTFYWMFLTGQKMTKMTPAIQGDWMDVFQFAWLPRAVEEEEGNDNGSETH